MALNMYNINQQIRRLNTTRAHIESSLSQLNTFEREILESWQSKETDWILRNIEKMRSELNQQMVEIDQVSRDIKKVAEEIKEEEKQEKLATI